MKEELIEAMNIAYNSLCLSVSIPFNDAGGFHVERLQWNDHSATGRGLEAPSYYLFSSPLNICFVRGGIK